MATASPPPPTMRAWQYRRTPVDTNLHLNTSVTVPIPKPTQHLVQILACSLNPIDYKPAEIPILGRLITGSPATPGVDIAGRIVIPAQGSSFKPGDLVFGAAGTLPVAGGALAEFAIAAKDHLAPLPEGVDPLDAATICVAGLSAYQSIIPRVKAGSRIFINGGSGGVGTFAIQFAKVMGCHVVTACSGRNVELCKRLGADEVVDYTKGDVVGQLSSICSSTGEGRKFDHVIDTIGSNSSLWWRAGEYMAPSAVMVIIGGQPTAWNLWETFKRKVIPGFLGGMQRKALGFWPDPKMEDVLQIANWMKDGKVVATVEQIFAFEQAPEAVKRLRSGRVRGKVVVDVGGLRKGNEPLSLP